MSSDPRERVVARRLRAEDIDTVAGFEREIASISFPEDPVLDLEFYKKRLSAALRDRKSHLIVLDLDGEPIGWAWIAPRTNFVTKEIYADLKSFYVAPRFRGSFCAMRLMGACLAYCRTHGLNRVVGRTSAQNANMKALYRWFSFTPKHVTFELFIDRAEREPAPPRDTCGSGQR
jgi:GNAT superfamily N-acetyltransferase